MENASCVHGDLQGHPYVQQPFALAFAGKMRGQFLHLQSQWSLVEYVGES